MNITNKYNLPQGLVDAVKQTLHPPKPDRFSVTHLVGPPLIRTLQIEKWKELEVDVSEYLWLILGLGVDMIISNTKSKDTIRQHKIEYVIDNLTVVGRLDVINEDILADWKCTSVWSFLHGVKPEWTGQLNVYDYILSQERKEKDNYIPIRYLKIYAVLRDWHQSKKYEKDYPPIAFQTLYVDKWTEEQQCDYLHSRLQDHIENPYRECTDGVNEEKWRSKTTYAVKTNGRKKALRVLDSMNDAAIWQEKNKRGDYIEERKGSCRRCEEYCPVRNICPFNKGK